MYHITFTRASLNLFRNKLKLKLPLLCPFIVSTTAHVAVISFMCSIESYNYNHNNYMFNFPLSVPLDVHIFLYLFTFLCIVILIYEKFTLPLPPRKFANTIFGPVKGPWTFNSQNESACYCHAYDTERKGFKRTQQHIRKRNSISSLIEGRTDFLNSIIGHRGAGMNSPENSLSGIRKCASRGCSMVEFDVSLTKDLVPVLFHDDNLLRVTGDERKLSDITWKELKDIDISEKFPGEKVPTLKEAVDLCLALGMRFIIDLKDEHDELVDSVVSIFQSYGDRAYSMGVVSSFYFRVIHKIRSRDSNIIGCMAWRPAFFALPHSTENHESLILKLFSRFRVIVMYAANDFAMKHIYWRILGLSAILVHKDALNMELIHKLQKKGLRVFAWTVNCPTEKRYFLNKLQVGYLTDTLEIEDHALPAPEIWLSNNNEVNDRAL